MTTSTRRANRGFTLVEMLVTALVGSIILIGVLSLAFYSARSFAALTNYVELDQYSRNALDRMTKEIRQADFLVSGSDHALRLRYTDSSSGTVYDVDFAYDSNARELKRVQGSQQTVLLKECDYLKFTMYQRNPISGTYDQYLTTDPSTCKLVQMTWICSREILGAKANTESVQSAKVVIRKI